ncbi:hypothetical protein ACTMU2_04860 [Cupriavidus basilensis]
MFNALDPLLDSTASLTGHETSLEQARALAADSQWLLDTGLAAHLDLLEPFSPAQAALREIRGGPGRARAGTCRRARRNVELARQAEPWRYRIGAGRSRGGWSRRSGAGCSPHGGGCAAN